MFIARSVEGAKWSAILETELLSYGRPLFGFLLHFGVQQHTHYRQKISLFLSRLCPDLNGPFHKPDTVIACGVHLSEEMAYC